MRPRRSFRKKSPAHALVYIPMAVIACVGYALGPQRVSLSPFYALLVIVAVPRHRGALGGLICVFCGSAAFLTVHLLWGDGSRVAEDGGIIDVLDSVF
jgi:hypothetical protein